MDKGEFIKGGYTVRPALDGGWIVAQGFADTDNFRVEMAFTDFEDLLAWLNEEHRVHGKPKSNVMNNISFNQWAVE